MGKAALTRSQPISFYHLEGLKVGKPWLDEDLPRACSWSLERAVITYRWATRRARSALQHIGNRNRRFIKPKKESTTERREERSQKLSTVTFKRGRSPGRQRTFSPTGFKIWLDESTTTLAQCWWQVPPEVPPISAAMGWSKQESHPCSWVPSKF